MSADPHAALSAIAEPRQGALEMLRPPSVDVLANGLRVVVCEQPHLQGATLSIFVKAGPRYEEQKKNGISHFLEHMLFRGTARHATTHELTLAAELLGGTLDAATYADFTAYQMTVPSEHAEAALALLQDLLAGPRFTDLELEQNIVCEEILADLSADGREVDAENLSRLFVFNDHPLGFKITGDVSHVQGFSRDDLRGHLQRFYGASNMAVVATGAVSRERVLAASRRLFSDLPRGRVALVSLPAPRHHAEHFRFVRNDASQSDVRIVFRTLGSFDPSFTAFKLLGRILDDGMSTRLHRRLTDDSGLAYDVFASIDPYEEAGLLEIGAAVAHVKVPELLGAALELMRELRDGGVTAEELAKAKLRYAWTLRRIIDSSEDMAMYAGTQAVFGRSIDLRSLLAEVERVTLAELARVLRRTVRGENLYVLVVGKLAKAAEKKSAALVQAFR